MWVCPYICHFAIEDLCNCADLVLVAGLSIAGPMTLYDLIIYAPSNTCLLTTMDHNSVG